MSNNFSAQHVLHLPFLQPNLHSAGGKDAAVRGCGVSRENDFADIWRKGRAYRCNLALLLRERNLSTRKEIHDRNRVAVYVQRSDPAAIVGSDETHVGRLAWGTEYPAIIGAAQVLRPAGVVRGREALQLGDGLCRLP